MTAEQREAFDEETRRADEAARRFFTASTVRVTAQPLVFDHTAPGCAV